MEYNKETLKNKMKPSTSKELEYTIITIKNLVSLVKLQKLVGEFIIGLDLYYLPEEIKSIVDY